MHDMNAYRGNSSDSEADPEMSRWTSNVNILPFFLIYFFMLYTLLSLALLADVNGNDDRVLPFLLHYFGKLATLT